MRLHIGNISPALAEHINDLTDRLSRYGELISPIELRKKPALETYFGFIDMNITPEKYKELRAALNGKKFKQSTLSIAEAKPKYDQLPDERKPIGPNDEQVKRAKSHLYEINVIKGRLREIPRENIRDATFRMWKGDRWYRIQCPKKRLWGYEKKLPQNLVCEFVDGEWRDWTGRPVEVAVRNELERNNRIVSQVNAGFLSDSEFEDFRQAHQEEELLDEDDDIEIEHRAPGVFSTYKDSDTDEEFYKNLKTDTATRDDDEEYEYKSEAEIADLSTLTEQKQNPTEALRDAFSAPSKFTLFGEEPTTVDIQETTVVAPPKVKATRKFGLFFAHFDSPFLQNQTQLSKLKKGFVPDEWNKLFYEHRGEWNRQMRRRRREEVRQLRRRAQVRRSNGF